MNSIEVKIWGVPHAERGETRGTTVLNKAQNMHVTFHFSNFNSSL